MTDSFISGTLIKDGVHIEVIGSDAGYRYRWLKADAEVTQSYVKCLPVLIIDFSESMRNNGDIEAYLATKSICQTLFTAGVTQIYLVFFGRTAYDIAVTESTYATTIDAALNEFFVRSNNILWNPDATNPVKAFDAVLNFVNKTNSCNINILFMTDGGFNEMQPVVYCQHWARLAKSFRAKAGLEIEINSIGFNNDHCLISKICMQLSILIRSPFAILPSSKRKR